MYHFYNIESGDIMDNSESLLICESDEMKAVKEKAKKYADTNDSILIIGETGVGKTQLASAIHSWSKRHESKFIKIVCSYKSAEMFRNELFGHEKGAYTGADTKQKGKIELADKGTLFLDEIGNLPLEAQTDLLEILEDKRQKKSITPVGSIDSISVNVRIIAATNINLEKSIKEGKFREDLYYRFDRFIEVPPLRKRELDMYYIFLNMKSILNKELKKKIEYICPEDEEKIFNLIREYQWPGNIRDFTRFLEEVFTLVSNTQTHIFKYEVERALSEIKLRNLHLPKESSINQLSKNLKYESLTKYLEEKEQEYIKKALIKNQWHTINTAKDLKISRNKLYRKIKKYQIIPTFS